MLGMVGVLTAAICTSCVDQQNPTGLRLGVPEPTVEQQLSDGCARFQVRFDAGGAPTIEPIFNTGSCALNDLKLLSDTAGSFDAATGTLRVAVVMENIGTTAVIPDVRLFFNADSVKRFDAQGEPVPGTPDILAYQPDSADGSGRRARWFWDAWLAPAGQPQVLPPGGRTQRRWVEFRGTGWTERVRLKLFAWGAKQSVVPATAPDSLPRRLLVESRVVTPSRGFRYYQDILLISFKVGTPLSERTRVLGLVGASVVGGFPNHFSEGGTYIVLLPHDSTQSALIQAEALMTSQSSVLRVRRYYAINLSTTYRRPNDGAVWSRQSWRIAGDSLLLPNILRPSWGVQYVRAPLAWGCSLGDTTTIIGFVDNGFQTGVSDMPGTFEFARGVNLPSDTVRHGTQVLSVVAAQGDNLGGITGLAWKARFSVADPTTTDTLGRPATDSVSGNRQVRPEDALQQIYVLRSSGAHIINVSLGAHDTPQVNLADTTQVREARQLAGDLRSMLTTFGMTPPLLVLSAGNVPLGDPRGSFFPFLKDSLPDYTIVVAAMDRDSTLLDAPEGSAYVDLAAPGVHIGVMDASGAALGSGASFATPIVTGIAALLHAFDARLTADSLRTLVLGGAMRRGRTVGGYPVADAYESLRLVAERPGAPLCGNRVWTANDKIVVQRSVGNANPVDEALADSLPFISRVNVFHGGRRVQNNIPSDTTGALIWNPNGTWTATTNLPLDPESGGTFWSLGGTDHDLTTFLDTKNSADVVTSSVFQLPNYNQTRSIVIGPYDEGADLSTALCIRMHGTTCETYTYTIRYVDPVDAIAPEADRGFVAVNHKVQTPTVTSWSACTDDPSEQCANVDLAVAPMGPTQIFELDLVNGTRTARWTVNAYVRWLAVSERNDELVAAEESGATCSLVYRDVRRPSVPGSALRTIPQAFNYCGYPGTATIAPRVSTPFGRK